jgi:WD40 repeat protein
LEARRYVLRNASLAESNLLLIVLQLSGTLVAHLAEHIAAINQIIISWDHTFFASCSDDGSVRIWDCSRLERNVTNRSRSTFNEQGKLWG